MGANAQGEIQLLAQIAEPTHGIITNIGRAHLEGFGGLDGVIKGKSELFEFFRSSAGATDTDHVSLFVNANHELLAEVSQSIPRLFYGTHEHPPFVSAVQDDFTMSWTDLDGIQHGPMHCHISGEHNFENMMTAYETYMKRYDPEGTKFYCAPPKLGLTIENTINIINDEAKRLQKKKPEEDINKVLVPFLYMWGMQQTFPCKN